MGNEMKKRKIILYTDDSDIKITYEIDSFLNNAGRGYYMDEVMVFGKLNEEYVRQHVPRIYIECLKGEIPSIHHTFCREIAVACDAEVFFKFEGLEIRVTKDTPDDWWDISIEDALVLHKDNPRKYRHVGPYYVNLSGELLKKSVWLCTMRIKNIDESITFGIECDYLNLKHTWRDEFRDYLEYRKFTTDRLLDIFIMKRRVKRYCDLMREQNEIFTQADADRFYEEYKEEENKYIEELEEKPKKRRRSKSTETKE